MYGSCSQAVLLTSVNVSSVYWSQTNTILVYTQGAYAHPATKMHNILIYFMQAFSVRPHCKNARRDRCQEYHNCFPFGELEETTRTSSTTWMKTIQQDLRSNNLSLDEAITVAQNRPFWTLMSAFGATHPYWCMQHKKKKKISGLAEFTRTTDEIT